MCKKAMGVVDIDLEKFFDRVNHDMLMARVARVVKDKRVLKLIRVYLNGRVANRSLELFREKLRRLTKAEANDLETLEARHNPIPRVGEVGSAVKTGRVRSGW